MALITFWTNVTAKGRAVHLGERWQGFANSVFVALCGYETDWASLVEEAATCKRCLKVAAKREAKWKARL